METFYRYRLVLEYDGRFFCGWQRQDNGRTVAGFLEEALQHFCGEHVSVVGAGRTDKGVHATGQVAHIDLPKAYACYTLTHGINAHLRALSYKNQWDFSPVSVLKSDAVDPTFHARFSAKARMYCYKIINRSAMLALQPGFYWHIFRPLDFCPMQDAACLLQGTHDFKTFQAQGCQSTSSVRTLEKVTISAQDDHLTITVLAPSFLYHQVRNIVGTLALVGQGKWSVNDFKVAFEKKDRCFAGPTAPAHGLYFVKVFY